MVISMSTPFLFGVQRQTMVDLSNRSIRELKIDVINCVLKFFFSGVTTEQFRICFDLH